MRNRARQKRKLSMMKASEWYDGTFSRTNRIQILGKPIKDGKSKNRTKCSRCFVIKRRGQYYLCDGSTWTRLPESPEFEQIIQKHATRQFSPSIHDVSQEIAHRSGYILRGYIQSWICYEISRMVYAYTTQNS